MDGAFVPNISFGAPIIKALRPHSKLYFDAHLMVEEPSRYLKDFAAAGAQLITVHAEACRHLHRTVQEIKSMGIAAGVALNPATPLCAVTEILDDLDLVLIMSVNPGFGGQKFIPSSLHKITELKKLILTNNLNIEIEVDGGVTPDNAAQIASAGADILVAGSAVFGASDIPEVISRLHEEGRRGKIMG